MSDAAILLAFQIGFWLCIATAALCLAAEWRAQRRSDSTPS
jgi:hypothetical protein